MATHTALSLYLVGDNYRHFTTDMLTLTCDSKMSLVCRDWNKITHQIMQKMWKEEMDRLEEVSCLPLNRDFLTKEEKVENCLKNRMLVVVPETDKTSLAGDVMTCYQRLLAAQKKVIYESTIRSKIEAFNAIQQTYSSCCSFERFIKNEQLIYDTELEMDQNLQSAWPHIQGALNLTVSSRPLNASEITEWIGYSPNQETLKTRYSCLQILGVGLSSVPKQVGLLKGLITLELSGNQLSGLPIELGCLSNLQDLNLNHNQLTAVPSVIKGLINLHTLYLNDNQIEKLPLEFNCLSRLENLYLKNNKFTQIPSVLGRLTNLVALDLSNNQIHEIPLFLADLAQRELIVDVAQNPIRSTHGFISNNICGIDRSRIEEMDVPFHDWMESQFAHRTFIRKVVAPIMGFLRKVLGYPPTIRIRLK